MKRRRSDNPERDLLRVERELARRDAADHFYRFLVYADPSYSMQWYHRLVAEKCQALFEGRIKNLMIFIPPQHGKSQIVSRMFPAWAFGIKPDLKIVDCSYSNDLATSFSIDVQRTMESPEYLDLFHDTRIAGTEEHPTGRKKKYKRNDDYFEIVGHKGFFKGVGVMQGLTGRTVDIAIIDDPVKDASEAFSATYRNKVWNWYTDVLRSRLHNRSHQIFIMTRWHEDDLAGRILKKEPDKWEVVRIPALCEVENDGGLSSRHVGDPLWAERHSKESLEERRALSESRFVSMYQQRPTAEGGNIVKNEWFGKISRHDFARLAASTTLGKERTPVVFFLDTAYTENTANDPSGILGACMIHNTLYLTCAEKVHLNFPDLIKFVPRFVMSNGYGRGSSLRIEPKANGLSVIDQLKASTTLSVIPTPTPQVDKMARLCTVSPVVESGRVYYVEGPWNDGFLTEVCGFPAQAHDEYVDDLVYAINHFLPPHRGVDVARLQEVLKR